MQSEYIYIYISAVKRLIAINRIQNKSFCLLNICVWTVYIHYVYINTHTCKSRFKKNMFICYMNRNIYMQKHVNIVKIYAACVFIYI